MASASGNGQWAETFTAFHARHKDPAGKNLRYTVVFNATLDGFIGCPDVPLTWRVLAWIWRHSWGYNSDFCIDKIGGRPLGQQACADFFRVDKQRVNDCVADLRTLNFLLPKSGQKMYPVDDPASYQSESPGPTGLSTPQNGYSSLFQEFCAHWKSVAPADFDKCESAEAAHIEWRKVRLGLFKKWKKARTSGDASLYTTTQQVQQEDPSSSVVDAPTATTTTTPSASTGAATAAATAPALEASVIPSRTTHARFNEIVQQAFAGQGKGMPTTSQMEAAFLLVPSHRDLAPLVPWLADRIPRLTHAGGLKALVAEWVAHGPTVVSAERRPTLKLQREMEEIREGADMLRAFRKMRGLT